MSDRKTKKGSYNHRAIHEAFARAERERDELQRLKTQHPQYSGLYFHPELLGTSQPAE